MASLATEYMDTVVLLLGIPAYCLSRCLRWSTCSYGLFLLMASLAILFLLNGALAISSIEPPTSVLLSSVSLLVGEAADAVAWMPGACISIFVGAEEARLRK